MPTSLSDAQIARYARHVLLREVGGVGQAKLLDGAVRVAGGGRAAEEAVIYLAAAGVGRIVAAPALVARLTARIAALNPDVTLTDDGPAAHEVQPADDERRAAGAMAALSALVVCAGVRDRHSWTVEPLEDPAWRH